MKYTHKQNNKEEIGVIAHELSELYPILVDGKKNDEKLQKVNYMGLVGLVTKELKKSKKELLENKEELLEIEKKIKCMKKTMCDNVYI